MPAPEAVVEVDGELVGLPVRVRSAKMVAASFFVDHAATQELIDYSGLRASEVRPGRAMCSISGVQYLDNDLGPYNEVAVAFAVEPHDGPAPLTSPFGGEVSTFIHRLPVNQAFTCAAGRDIWGFPKWIARIDYHDRGDRTEVLLTDEGQLALGLEVRRGPVPLPPREMAMRAYAWRDGVLRMTPWTTRNELVRARPGGVTLALGADHPLGIELAALGLPARALFSLVTAKMQASFGPPEVVTPTH